ncbi:hypothetical protein D3C87_447290 [compost metagenome]
MKVTTLVGRSSFAVRCTFSFMPGVYLPEAMRTKAMRSRWLASMLACTLKTTPAKSLSSGWISFTTGWRLTSVVLVRDCGEGARSTSASSTSITPKLFTPEPKNTGVCLPARKASRSQVGEAPVASSMLSMACSKSAPKRLTSVSRSLSGMVSKSCGSRSLPDSNTVIACVRRFMMPRKLLPWPTGQVMGTQGMPSSRSTSSRMSSGSRTSRSILLTKVMMGVSRWRQTSISRRVCASTPLAASITISAESTAVSTR